MKIATAIWIDKRVIATFVRCLNVFIILAGKILRIDHSLDKDFKTIAISKYKGMGSILQSSALVKTLRAKYPDAKIIYISSNANLQLLKRIPEIDEVVCLDDRSFFCLLSGFPSFICRLMGARIQLYIDLEVYSSFSTLVAISSLATNRMGFYLSSMHFRLGNYTHMMYYNTRSAISDTYLQFARLLGCEKLVREMVQLDSSVKELDLGEKGDFDLVKNNYIVINPNASDLRIERRWGKEKVTDLIRMFRVRYPEIPVLLVGAPNEIDYVQEIMFELSGLAAVYSLAGKTSIDQLVAVIKQAAVFVSNDTGPMHIAFSVGAKTVALFGPCSPVQFGSSSNAVVLYANMYCSPCVHEFVAPPCKGNNLCMKAIPVTQVMDCVGHIIEHGQVPSVELQGEMLFEVAVQGRRVIAGAVN